LVGGIVDEVMTDAFKENEAIIQASIK
jgi:hypothetical protein